MMELESWIDHEGDYWAVYRGYPSLSAFAKTKKEAIHELKKVYKMAIESKIDRFRYINMGKTLCILWDWCKTQDSDYGKTVLYMQDVFNAEIKPFDKCNFLYMNLMRIRYDEINLKQTRAEAFKICKPYDLLTLEGHRDES